MTVAEIVRGLPGGDTVAHLGRRTRGEFLVDEWGLDPEMVAMADPALSLRWSIEVTGAEHLAAVGGAVLVFNRRFGISEPWVLARGIRQASGRFVRTVGVPDISPVGPLLRRFGGVLDQTEEIAGLLRAGQLVGLPLAHARRVRDQAGALDVDRLEAAIAAEAPVVPVALIGREAGRRWRIVVGEPVRLVKPGPLPAVELAEATHAAVQDLLDDSVSPSWWL